MHVAPEERAKNMPQRMNIQRRLRMHHTPENGKTGSD